MRVTGSQTLHLLLCGMILAIFFSAGSATPAYAQFGAETGASLVANPTHPGPEKEVTVRLEVFSVNTVGATIRWFIDGVEVPRFENERSITITTGPLGSETNVRALIQSSQGPEFSLQTVLRPVTVDLIFEADTRIPSFYKGRSLGSAESPMKVVAIPHLEKPAATYTYEWKLNQKVLFGGPVRGQQTVEIELPMFDTIPFSVAVYDDSGTIVAQRTTILRNTPPELFFYEENPLRGLSRKAVSNSLVLLGEETLVRAEPYFVNQASADANGVIEWRIDGEVANTAAEDPYSITLRKTGGSGDARVDFRFNNLQKLFQSVQDSFRVTF